MVIAVINIMSFVIGANFEEELPHNLKKSPHDQLITCMQFMSIIAAQVPHGLPESVLSTDPDTGEKGALLKIWDDPRGMSLFPVSLLLIFPICLLPDLTMLKWPSLLGLLFMAFSFFVVVIDGFSGGYWSAAMEGLETDSVEVGAPPWRAWKQTV